MLKKGALGVIVLVVLIVVVPVLYFVGKGLTGLIIGAAVDVTNCGLLDQANTVYVLLNDVQDPGFCFTVTANNVTLDGQGFSVNHSSTTGSTSGIEIAGANGSTIKHVLIREVGLTNTNRGIRISRAVNTTVFNTTIIVNRSLSNGIRFDGVSTSPSSFNTIFSNNITVIGPFGSSDALSLSNAHANNISNNILSILRDLGNSGGSDGVSMTDSSNNTFSNNILLIQSVNSSGYRFFSSASMVYGTTIINDSIRVTGTRSHGIVISSSAVTTNNTLMRVDIHSEGQEGNALNISEINSNLTFIDSRLNASHATAFDINIGGDGTLLLINTTLMSNNINFGPSALASVIVGWYLDANAAYISGTPAEGANISAWNSTNALVFSQLTNAAGSINRTVLQEYQRNQSGFFYQTLYNISGALGIEVINITLNLTKSTGVNFTFTSSDGIPPEVTIKEPQNITYALSSIPFSFSLNEAGSCMYSFDGGITNFSMAANASNTGFSAVHTTIADGSYTARAYCMDAFGNRNDTASIVFSKETGSNVTLCQELNLSGTVYILKNNVSSSGTCFSITANNVTLDCKGYEINYSYGSGGNNFGVYIARVNFTTIKNCRIIDGANQSSNKPALYFSDANNGIIEKNTISTLSDDADGIRLESTVSYSNANYYRIQDNTLTMYGNRSDGISFINSMSFNNVTGNRIVLANFGMANGIVLNFDTDRSVFNNNTITASSTSDENIRAFYLLTSSNFNQISNLNITTSSANGFGVQAQGSGDNTFENISITTSGSSASGIRITGITNTTFKNVQVTTSGSSARGLRIMGTSNFEMRDSVLNAINPLSSDIRITGNVNGGEWNFTNVSFDTKIWDAGANGTLNRHWYLDAFAYYSNGINASGTNISAYDKNAVLRFSALTGQEGRILRQTLLDSTETNSSSSTLLTTYSNYSFEANLSGGGSTERQSWNMTQNRDLTFLFTPVGFPEIAFLPPTPPDQGNTEKNFVINTSIATPSPLETFLFTLRGINYTFYDQSLVLMINFDNKSSLGENDTLVMDFSRYGNNGAVHNGTGICGNNDCPQWNSYGKYGGAFSFDGANDYIDLGTPSVLNNNIDNITISAWVKVVANLGNKDTNYEIFTNELFNSSGYVLRIEDNNPPANPGIIRFRLSQGGSDTQVKTSALTYPNDNVWHHIVGMKKGSEAMIYLDGVLVGYNASVAPPANSPASSKISGIDQSFNGSIDEVRIWNRSLSQDEIQEQYYSNLNKYNQTQWYFEVNQRNVTKGIAPYAILARNVDGKQSMISQFVTVFNPVLVVEALFPANNSALTTSSIDYQFNVTSLYSLVNCSLRIDSLLVPNTSNTINGVNIISFGTPDGAHTYDVACTDALGNTATSSNISFSVSTSTPPPSTPPPGGSPPGPPGGGSTPKIYTLTPAQFDNGFRVYLARKDGIKITSNNKNHTLILEVLKNNSITMVFGAKNMSLGFETVMMNLDGDSTFDLVFALERIVNNTAGIFIKKFQKPPIVEEPPEENLTSGDMNKSLNTTDLSKSAVSSDAQALTVYKVVVALLMILIILVSLIIMIVYLARKKRRGASLSKIYGGVSERR